jgi:hypothetical protein
MARQAKSPALSLAGDGFSARLLQAVVYLSNSAKLI